MVTANRPGQMDPITKESGTTTMLKVGAISCFRMETCTMDISTEIWPMEKEPSRGKMEVLVLESG